MLLQKSKPQSVLALVLSLIIILSFQFTAYANSVTDDEIEPYFINISHQVAYLSISGIKAQCKADLHSKKELPLKIVMELQKQKSDGYKTVET